MKSYEPECTFIEISKLNKSSEGGQNNLTGKGKKNYKRSFFFEPERTYKKFTTQRQALQYFDSGMKPN